MNHRRQIEELLKLKKAQIEEKKNSKVALDLLERKKIVEIETYLKEFEGLKIGDKTVLVDKINALSGKEHVRLRFDNGEFLLGASWYKKTASYTVWVLSPCTEKLLVLNHYSDIQKMIEGITNYMVDYSEREI